MNATPEPAPPPQLRGTSADDGPRWSGLAIAALACGIVAVFTVGITAVAAVPLGHVALRHTARNGTRGRWMAVVGLLIGWLCVAVWLLYGLSVLYGPDTAP